MDGDKQRIKVWVQRLPDRDNLVLQWTDPVTGKRKTRSAGTTDEVKAENMRGDLEADLNHGRVPSGGVASTGPLTWTAFRKMYEAEHLPATRPRSREGILTALDHFERIVQPTTLADVSERTLSAFVAGLRQDPGQRAGETKKPGSVKVQATFVHTALLWAVAQKLLPYAPALPALPVPKKVPQPVPTDAWERLLLEAGEDTQMRAYLLCGWLAGLRLREAYSLRRHETEGEPWVDWTGQRIVLPAESVKGGADQELPLDPRLAAVLKELPQHDSGHVFRITGQIRGRGPEIVLKANSVSARIIKMAQAAGLKLNMRALRRGFGCRYAATVPAQVLQRLMRHADISLSVMYYINTDAAARAAVLGQQGSL